MAHAHSHGELAAPFADIHVEGDTVRVTLLHDPVIEGVEMALYLDGSASMADEYEYKDMPRESHEHDHAPPAATGGAVALADDHADDHGKGEKKGWLARLFGWFSGGGDDHDDDDDDDHDGADDHDDDDDDDDHDDHGAKGPTERTNQVERPVREMLQYLATKDRNGRLRVAYWACGKGGRAIEHIGELGAGDAATTSFPGPKDSGSGTCLLPALKDFIAYVEAKAAKGATRACGVFVTDGQIQDEGGVKKFSAEIAARIAHETLPPLHLVLVGVGDQVSESQMENIGHVEHPGAEHLWCHRVASEMHQMAELVSGLVDETMTVASGGTLYDAHGRVLREYKGRLPAVLEFARPRGDRSFTLEIEGRRYTQALPE